MDTPKQLLHAGEHGATAGATNRDFCRRAQPGIHTAVLIEAAERAWMQAFAGMKPRFILAGRAI